MAENSSVTPSHRRSKLKQVAVAATVAATMTAGLSCAVTGGVARTHRYGFQWVGWCWAMTTFFVAGALINLIPLSH